MQFERSIALHRRDSRLQSPSRGRARGLTVALFWELEDVLPAHDSPGLPLPGAVCLKCCSAVPVGRALGFSLLALPCSWDLCIFGSSGFIYPAHAEGLEHQLLFTVCQVLPNRSLPEEYNFLYLSIRIDSPSLPHKKLQEIRQKTKLSLVFTAVTFPCAATKLC